MGIASKRPHDIRNTIAQRTQAPYDLRGAVDGKNLNLTWKPVSEAPVLTYETAAEIIWHSA